MVSQSKHERRKAKGSYYANAAQKERALVRELRQRGCIAARSAGSHSLVDVWAIDVLNAEVLLYQLKPKTLSKRKEEELYKDFKFLDSNNNFKVRFEVRT